MRTLVYADDGEARRFRRFTNAVADPSGSLVRRSSLEDVSYILTGRTLVDRNDDDDAWPGAGCVLACHHLSAIRSATCWGPCCSRCCTCSGLGVGGSARSSIGLLSLRGRARWCVVRCIHLARPDGDDHGVGRRDRSMWPILGSFLWDRAYHGISAAPLGSGDISAVRTVNGWPFGCTVTSAAVAAVLVLFPGAQAGVGSGGCRVSADRCCLCNAADGVRGDEGNLTESFPRCNGS